MDEDVKIWKRAALIHGHECGGLMIGYKAANSDRTERLFRRNGASIPF